MYPVVFTEFTDATNGIAVDGKSKHRLSEVTLLLLCFRFQVFFSVLFMRLSTGYKIKIRNKDKDKEFHLSTVRLLKYIF